MLTMKDGTLTIREGRLTVDELMIESGAVVQNDAEIHTYGTVSEGEIKGRGTLWAHYTSRPIGGIVDALQIIIYYPKTAGIVLPIVFGNLFSIQKRTGDGELT